MQLSTSLRSLRVDTVDRIEEVIVASAEGFFAETNIRQVLHVTIRIASDFYEFLVKFGEQPAAKEIAYVTDTVRSGMDEFFQLAYLCRIINTGPENWRFDPQAHWDFPKLRERFMRSFEQLAGSADAITGLASLLELTHLELVFLAQHFPSAILEAI